jgi:serine/threonine-protein kinase
LVEVLRGKYRIVREIARSNDIIYEATDITLGRQVALKELNLSPGLTGQARRERIARFEREAKAAGRLTHPNIVSIFGSGEENGRHFIAMEFLDGQNLRDRMQTAGGPLSLKESLDIICQVLDALHYAHARNVIHRDIKPDNIQILTGGQVKLTDFGIARLIEEPALTSNGQIFGTPSYMSPEQIEGKHIDHRSDLFGVGVVLYEMLTGRKPFTGDSVVSITYAIMHADPPPMTGVPSAIEQVIRRALSKSPLQRQRTAEEMKIDLRAAEQTPPMFFSPNPAPAPPCQTNLGFGYYQTGGASGGYSPSPSGYGGIPSVPPPGGYQPPMPMPQPAQGNLPWAWNGQQANAAQQPSGAVASGSISGMPPGSMIPYANSPFPTRPRDPAIHLSPTTRSFLAYLALAVLMGGGIALLYVGFLKSYESYRNQANAQQVVQRMNEGVKAINRKDYEKAVEKLELALAANPDPKEGAKVRFNLGVAYAQLGDKYRGSNLAQASEYYGKARALFEQALSVALSRDDLKEVAERSQQALDGLPRDLPVSRLTGTDRSVQDARSTALLPSSSAPSDRMTSEKLSNAPTLQDQRALAQRLLREGDALYQKGDYEGAKQKYTQATGTALGTPEYQEAMNRLRQVIQATSNSGENAWQ